MELYNSIFQKNIGVITREEQQILKHSKIGIAGVGGVGGNVAHLLVRAGVESFKLADMDTFSISNTNRQYACNTDSIGQNKAETVKRELQKINPCSSIELFQNGITSDNLPAFLDDVTIIVDALDFYALDIRREMMSKVNDGKYFYLCPALGFGANLVVFGAGGMAFNDFFPISNSTDTGNMQDQILKFAYTVFPKIPDYVDVKGYMDAIIIQNHLPTFSTSVMLASVITANEIILHLLNRRTPKLAPYIHQIDLFDYWN